jgi:MFS family permease
LSQPPCFCKRYGNPLVYIDTAIMGLLKAPNTGHGSDPIVTRMVEQDKVPWYKKRNLRIMYLYLFACCMGVEITSGFDSQLINTLQFSPAFNKYFGDGYMNPKTGKPDIRPSILGFISSCYQLGSILAVPIAPWYNQKFGRRSCIMCGSVIMVIGAILQGFSQHRMLAPVTRTESLNSNSFQLLCTSLPVCCLVSVSFSVSSLAQRLSVNLVTPRNDHI